MRRTWSPAECLSTLKGRRKCYTIYNLNPSNDLCRRIPVDVVLHPRNLDFIFIAYGGTSLPDDSLVALWLRFHSSAGGIALIDLVTWLSSCSMKY
jgi:hypothetical protein